MKNFLTYLTKHPLKIVWLLFITVFVITLISILIYYRQILISDNSIVVYLLLHLFAQTILALSFVQVYKEYKDGL